VGKWVGATQRCPKHSVWDSGGGGGATSQPSPAGSAMMSASDRPPPTAGPGTAGPLASETNGSSAPSEARIDGPASLARPPRSGASATGARRASGRPGSPLPLDTAAPGRGAFRRRRGRSFRFTGRPSSSALRRSSSAASASCGRCLRRPRCSRSERRSCTAPATRQNKRRRCGVADRARHGMAAASGNGSKVWGRSHQLPRQAPRKTRPRFGYAPSLN
jgi:hypothetical protein